MKLRQFFFGVLAAVCVSSIAFAQDGMDRFKPINPLIAKNVSSLKLSEIQSVADALDAFIETSANHYNITGIPLTLQCGQDAAKTYAAGNNSINGMPVDKDSLFQIGSISKSFVSVVVLQLEAEGKLSLNDTVAHFFQNNRFPHWNTITLKQLLNMTSGIHDYFNDETAVFEMMVKDPYRHITTPELLDSVKELNIWFPPGKGWRYSNTNYVLAGLIVEKVTGKAIDEEIRQRIIEPLHLKNTFYITKTPKEGTPADKWHHLMSGYYYDPTPVPPYFSNGIDMIDYSVSWGNAAGSITSTSNDINTYIRQLFDNTLLPKKQMKELVSAVDIDTGNPLPKGVDTIHLQGYGLGIGIFYDTETQSIIYTHSGGTMGFISQWQLNANTQSSMTLAFNSLKRDENLGKLLGPIALAYQRECGNLSTLPKTIIK